MNDPRPIGVFDSGVGGLTVLREVCALLPTEDVMYLADSARCPYGQRTRDEIIAYSCAAAQFLVDNAAKLILVACNTASVASLDHLRRRFPVPFVGVVPAVKPAASSSQKRRVGIMATDATLGGEAFAQLCNQFASDTILVEPSCHGLVELIESSDLGSAEVMNALRSCLDVFHEAEVDALVLGCTHYVFLRRPIEDIMGPHVQIYDSGLAVAQQVARVIESNQLAAPIHQKGTVRYFTTGSAAAFQASVARLLGQPNCRVTHVDLDISSSMSGE